MTAPQNAWKINTIYILSVFLNKDTRFTDFQIKNIENKLTGNKIAELFDVSPSVISKIKNNMNKDNK